METDNITQRVREFLALNGNRYKELEEQTSVEAYRWSNLQRGSTKAVPADMLDALSRQWPQYALWLVTGRTEPQNGHLSPLPAQAESGDGTPAERLRVAAKLVWGDDITEIERITGVSRSTWNAAFEGDFEVDPRLLALLTKGGGQYVNWVVSGHADTYFQLSAKDKWPEKLARGLGADIDRKPNSLGAKVVKALGSKKDSPR